MTNSTTHKTWISRTTRRIACLALGVAALALGIPESAHAQIIVAPPVPPGLEVQGQAFLLGHAIGTQNYECQPTGQLGHVDWVLFTPEATLFDDAQNQLITHFFSPNPAEGTIVRATWQASGDTSAVWARAVATAIVDPTAIAWVKLQAVGTQIGPTHGETLSATTFVQRINTKGGLAPTTGCDGPTDVGHKAFMPYTADYVFFRN